MLAIDGRRYLSLHYCFVHRTFSIAHPRIRCNNFFVISCPFFVRRPRRQQANEVSALVNPVLNPGLNPIISPILYPILNTFILVNPPFITITTPRLFS
nr:MAG TPA: hypothetical protein [Caudoviricetes sp.]